MKSKQFISAVTAITVMFSGVAFSAYMPLSEITATAFSLEESYPNPAAYTAGCIIGGLIDPETGDHSESITTFSDVIERNYAYEQLANNVMEDKGLVITSSMWDTFSKALAGKVSAVSGELRQEQVYEAFLMDYLTFSEGSTENSSFLDKAGDFADKTMKYENKILKKLLDKGIAVDEKSLAELIEKSDSLNDPEVVEAMKELNWEKDLVGYTKILDDITEVATNAENYFEALTKAMALKEVNDERISFLKSMSEKASDNSAFQTAVDKIIETIESSYGEIALEEGVKTMGSFAWGKCWKALSKNIPYFSTFKTAHEAVNYLFNTDSMAENNIRIIMQYTVGQYAKQVLMSSYVDSSTSMDTEKEKADADFVEAYKNYVAYQCYSSEWAKNFVEAVPFTSSTTVDEWLSALNSDINYCNSCISFTGKYAEIYVKAVYAQIDFSDDETDDDATSDGHTYKIFDYDMTWSEAEAYCEELGGHLVSITSQEEQKAIEELLESGTRNSYWIGATKSSNNNWNWVTGEDFKYQNWGDTQPDNFCNSENAAMIYRKINPKNPSKFGEWNDLKDDGTCNGENFFGVKNFGFICEWDTSDVQTEDFDADIMVLDGHSYKLVPMKKFWTDAESYAEELGGHLVTVNSSSEQTMVEKMISRYAGSDFWLGGYYSTDTDEWKWIDDTEFDYNNWQEGQPDNYWENEFYTEIHSATTEYEGYTEEFGKWNDCPDDAEDDGNYFIIEWEHLGHTVLGDINQNEDISIADAVLVQRYLLGSYSFTETQLELADINQDGRVDVFDMVEMRKLLIQNHSK